VPDPPPRWIEGTQLDGGYVIGRSLGSGAFGVVHLVDHRALARTWAAKVIRRDLTADVHRRELLLHELALALRLTGHPHVVRAEMFRSFGDEIAILSELIDGAPLATLLADPRFSAPEAVLVLALQLAWALESIHAAGLIHADVKPSNVLVARDGTAKIADLGLASLAQARTRDARGTPRYRSPEQAKTLAITPATDVWSWAVTVLALLIGDEPAHASGEAAPHTLAAVRARPPVHAAFDELDGLLQSCLRKRPEDRPTMTAIVDQLSAQIERRTAVAPRRPAPGPIGTTLASELSLHTEALRPLIDDRGEYRPSTHDTALRISIAKADCHRRAGDLAGAVNTLERALRAASTAGAARRAAAWLDLGGAHHERGASSAAIHAFDQAASAVEDPVLRARAHRGAGVAAWVGGDRPGAVDRLRAAAQLAAHAIDTGNSSEARQVHTEILLALASMLRELGDRAAYEACLAHGLQASRSLDDAGRQTLVQGLILHGDFSRARTAVHGLLPADDSPAAIEASAGASLIAATIDLEEARALASQPRQASALARRACDRLRPLAIRGVTSATLPLAVAELHLAWLLRAAGEIVDRGSIERALITLDGAARAGRRDAASLASWTRAMLPRTGRGPP
jgi:tetratricopeptide (TPR) repeat protein